MADNIIEKTLKVESVTPFQNKNKNFHKNYKNGLILLNSHNSSFLGNLCYSLVVGLFTLNKVELVTPHF